MCLFLGKSGCIQVKCYILAKGMCLGISGCTRAKWLYLGKSGFIPERVNVFVQSR